MNDVRTSLLQMAKGAIMERVDYEVERVVDNILDGRTDPTAKRKVVLTVEMRPDEERQIIKICASAKSTLAHTMPVDTSLIITADHNGEMVLAEIVPQIPGQMDFSGEEQQRPKILKRVSEG